MRGARNGAAVGRRRGRGNDRNFRSRGPATNTRDNLNLSRQSHRSLSPPPSRRGRYRSPSPVANRPRRSPIRRRSPHLAPSLQHHGERSPPLVPALQRHSDMDYPGGRLDQGRHPPVSFRQEAFRFQQEYALSDRPTVSNDMHALRSSSRTTKDKDMVGSSLGIDDHGMLVQKSLFMDDGSKRTFYTLQQNAVHPYDSAAPSLSQHFRSIGSGDSSINGGLPRYNQRMSDNYDDKERGRLLLSRYISHPVIPPPSQSRLERPPVSTSLSNFSYGGHSDTGNFLDDPLEYKGYGQVQLSDSMRLPGNLPSRGSSFQDHRYDELGHKGRENQNYLSSDGLYQREVYGSRAEFEDTENSSFSDFAGGRANSAGAYRRKIPTDGSFWDQHNSTYGDPLTGFHDLKGIRQNYIGSSASGYTEIGSKASPDRDLLQFEDGHSFRRDMPPVAYKERPNSPLLVDHPPDIIRRGASHSREISTLHNHIDTFNPSPERNFRRNFVVDDDLDGLTVHRRIQSPIHGDGMWATEEHGIIDERRRYASYKTSAIGHSQYRMPSHRLSRTGGQRISSSSADMDTIQRRSSIKKRLRPGPSDFYGSLASERRKEVFRPVKVWKRSQEDGNCSQNCNASDVDDRVDAVCSLKNDPPADSEEFKQQIHKAFLRFSKVLNESPHQQKMYLDDEGKPRKLLCCACGRLSKEFVDVHSLLSHSYHTQKLRTEHLGFHKALCVLNGWNWLVVPEMSKAYKQSSPPELKTLKEDLILWPPIVVIHNSSIGSKVKTNGPKVVSNERMELILEEMGFGARKTQVGRGKPANQSVLLVKFSPTLSGLQEAERLHKYYADKNRGRQELQLITSDGGNSGQAWVEKDEELLYGYMAIAEDLDKLDPETKKRCLVKSKKDIEAIADAPLNT